jgi:hypothetical protein
MGAAGGGTTGGDGSGTTEAAGSGMTAADGGTTASRTAIAVGCPRTASGDLNCFGISAFTMSISRAVTLLLCLSSTAACCQAALHEECCTSASLTALQFTRASAGASG